MNKQLLVICGPTAVGKTDVALYLGKKFDGELVSADSRQVYKGMDIGTGKDLPEDSKFQSSKIILEIKNTELGFYLIRGVRVWGYDLVGPKKKFSVGQYLKIAKGIIEDVWRRGKLPILVGGTGLYIQGVVDGIATASIPRNEELRKRFAGKSADELFEILAGVDPIKAGSMNKSDKNNPRRLLRAIEIAITKSKEQLPDNSGSVRAKKVLFIGLSFSRKKLNKKIEERVYKRVKKGIQMEIRDLLENGVSWNDQSMTSLGYRQWKGYFNGKKRKKDVIDEWIREEKKYARRQIAWFRKDERINWFNLNNKNEQKAMEEMIKKWHNQEEKE